ncbi:ABC transporter permease [Chitiniphilus eburneus]|uniref:ABC transporter permease n=1 Tax=Chitiniphilus eburneus TaxID=2571148 RepID=UPI0035D13647
MFSLNSLALPLRNVMRNRRRTLVTLITLIVGEIALLIFGGYANAVVDGMQTGIVQQIGHLQIQRKNYFLLGTGSPMDYGIADYRKVIAAVEADPQLKNMVKVTTPLLQLQGIAGNFNRGVSRTVAGYGYVAADQNRMREWNEYRFPIEPKKIALPEGQSDVVSLGIGVARTLRLCDALTVPNCPKGEVADKNPGGKAMPDDIGALTELEAASPNLPASDGQPRLDVLAATANGAPNVINARVAAAESLGVKEIDDSYMAMPLEMAQQLVYGRDTPQVTSIVLQLRSTADIDTVRARLTRIIQDHGWDLEVLDYRTLFPAYDQTRGLFASIFGFILLLIGTIVLFSVANTMSTVVMERTVEIGTLRSMGMRRAGIARQFLSEGLIIGTLGTVLGCGLAVLCALAINSAGFTWTPPNSIEKIPLVVHMFNTPDLIVGSVAALLLLAAISSLLPAYRAARIPVVEALRHV